MSRSRPLATASRTLAAASPVFALAAALALAACDRDQSLTGPVDGPADLPNPAQGTFAAGVTATANAVNGKLAFESSRDGNFEIYVMNADGSSQTDLTNNPADDQQAAWSPDGTKIAFTSTRDGNYEIYVMRADGSAPVRLTNDPADDVDPTWSPDGTRLAFGSTRDGDSEIYVMNADGSGQTRLTTSGGMDHAAAWSPDGGKIAFTSWRNGNAEIYVMNADGSAQTNLTNNPASDIMPAWSPDGGKLAFATKRDGNDEIYVMNAADGTAPTRLTTNAATDAEPAWAPDGSKLAFSSYRDLDYEIYTMNPDGTAPTRVASRPGYDGSPAWGTAPQSATNQAPDGTISAPAANVTITVGQSVSFAGAGTDADGVVASYAWSFPGGSPSAGTAPTPGAVTFATAGTYTVTLTVTDDRGAADPSPATRTITVQPAASGVSVAVADNAFTPTAVTSPQGGTVTWAFQGPDVHNVTDRSGMGLFASGDKAAGTSYAFRFVAAGTYGYRCTKPHPTPMTGTVKVPLTLSAARGTASTSFTVTWASATAPAGYVYDVQIKRPGSTAFVNWKAGQTLRSAAFVPDAGIGTYGFRARLRQSATGRASGYSPAKSISVQ